MLDKWLKQKIDVKWGQSKTVPERRKMKAFLMVWQITRCWSAHGAFRQQFCKVAWDTLPLAEKNPNQNKFKKCVVWECVLKKGIYDGFLHSARATKQKLKRCCQVNKKKKNYSEVKKETMVQHPTSNVWKLDSLGHYRAWWLGFSSAEAKRKHGSNTEADSSVFFPLAVAN